MKDRNWIKILLTPFSWLYGSVTSLRNIFFDYGIFTSVKPSQFTISVGNLTVGGTGKTPMVEHLAKLFKQRNNVAILSRGYGRKTHGLFFADELSAASDIGDEPLQYFTKYGKSVIVAVCENRVKGADAIHKRFPNCNILLLDDAFQHRAILPDVQILLNDFNRPFYEDLPFPAGRLREFRTGARRADAVVVTKCPAEIAEFEKEQITKRILKYTQPQTPVFFAGVKYESPVTYSNQIISLNKVKAVAGIASPLPFLAFLRSSYEVVEEIIFPDHHNYTITELERLIKNLKSDTFVLTTEKDMVKLKPLATEMGKLANFAYIPISVNMGKDAERFDQWISGLIPY